MNTEDDDAGSQGAHSVIDEILDLYRMHWEPEYRVKFKKELAKFSLGMAVSKPHQASPRLRLMLKPEQVDSGWHMGRVVQKVLVMPRQHFLAAYSRKMSFAWGILRCQFVMGYFWNTRRPSLDYRFTTKWSGGLRMKRKEYYQPTHHLLIRAKWALDMQLPVAEGHLGGGVDSTQVPVEVEYGSLDFSVTQLDFVCDLDGYKDRGKVRGLLPVAQPLLDGDSAPEAAAASGSSCCGSSSSGAWNAAGSSQALGSLSHGRSNWSWPWHQQQKQQASEESKAVAAASRCAG